jgi:hypothetical protein
MLQMLYISRGDALIAVLLLLLAAGDLAFNVALGATLVAIPLTIGAVARSAFVKYKFTDKRVSVITAAPWESELPGLRMKAVTHTCIEDSQLKCTCRCTASPSYLECQQLCAVSGCDDIKAVARKGRNPCQVAGNQTTYAAAGVCRAVSAFTSLTVLLHAARPFAYVQTSRLTARTRK